MGMSVGESKGGAMAEMNVVPLIDILLVLMIIFMVITPLTPKGLDTWSLSRTRTSSRTRKSTIRLWSCRLRRTANSRSITKTPPGTVLARAWNKFSKIARRK